MAYADGDVLVRAVMTNASGLVEDQVINDFAFHAALEPDDPHKTAIFAAVNDFYRNLTGTLHAVGEYISNSVSRSATHRLDMYKITAGPLGSPIASQPWLGPPAQAVAQTEPMPNEVAACLSYYAEWEGSLEELGATRPRARHRGRLYLGPLNRSAITALAGGANPKLADEFLDTLRQAGVHLMNQIDPGGGSGWGVWSRKDQMVRKVVGGFTNNAPDTQRRRGQNPTAKVLWGGDPAP